MRLDTDAQIRYTDPSGGFYLEYVLQKVANWTGVSGLYLICIYVACLVLDISEMVIVLTKLLTNENDLSTWWCNRNSTNP